MQSSCTEPVTMSGTAAVVIIVVLVLLFVVYSLYLSVQVVREKENVIIERFGEFKAVVRTGASPWSLP